MNNVCLKSCRASIAKDEDEFELNKFRGVKDFSSELRENFLFEADIYGQCDFYLCEYAEVPAFVFCEKVGINYFNSLDMYVDVFKYIEDNKYLIADDVYEYIKDSIDMSIFSISVGNYLSCHSELFKDDKACIDINKEEARVRGFAVDYVHNVFVAVAYRYLYSCIHGSQRTDFHTFKI